MRKIISLLCIFGLAGVSVSYAQSKKEIIATQQAQLQAQQAQLQAQQAQLQAQQHQLDSLRVANAYLQGYQNQLQTQVNRLDSINGQMQNRCWQLQHQKDSLDMVTQNLQSQVERQASQLQKQTAAANKRAVAEQKQAQQNKKDFEAMMATYRAGCAQSEAKLKKFFDEDKHGVNQFLQTKTALLEAYENKCEAGKVSSVDEVKWEVQKTEGQSYAKAGIHYLFENKYAFLVQCPNGRSYAAYDICFQTSVRGMDYDIVSSPRNSLRAHAPVQAYVPCQEQAQRLMHSGRVR